MTWNRPKNPQDNKSAGLISPDFKTYQSTVTKIVWNWHKDKLISGVESKVQKQPYTFMNFKKGAKKIQWQRIIFSTNSTGGKKIIYIFK